MTREIAIPDCDKSRERGMILAGDVRTGTECLRRPFRALASGMRRRNPRRWPRPRVATAATDCDRHDRAPPSHLTGMSANIQRAVGAVRRVRMFQLCIIRQFLETSPEHARNQSFGGNARTSGWWPRPQCRLATPSDAKRLPSSRPL